MTTLIELTGPASSGKTTLARELAERNGWVFIGEPIYDNVEDKIENEEDAKDFQLEVVENHFDNLMMAANYNADVIITDRCLLDLAVYGFLHIEDAEFTKEYSDQVCKAYDIIADKYDEIITFYCQSVGFKDNGIRSDSNYELEKTLFHEHSLLISVKMLPQDKDLRLSEIEKHFK